MAPQGHADAKDEARLSRKLPTPGALPLPPARLPVNLWGAGLSFSPFPSLQALGQESRVHGPASAVKGHLDRFGPCGPNWPPSAHEAPDEPKAYSGHKEDQRKRGKEEANGREEGKQGRKEVGAC